MANEPGYKGPPSAEKQQPRQGSGEKPDLQTERAGSDRLENDLDDTFPGSDAPAATRRTKTD